MTILAGVGISTKNYNGTDLETYFPQPLLLQRAENTASGGLTGDNSFNDPQLQSQWQQLKGASNTVFCQQHIDEPPASVAQAYLKLQAISHRLFQPHSLNLTGIFATLKNVAWTSAGAIDLTELHDRQLQARLEGKPITIFSVDKFPRMVDYIVPQGIRIADTARVRLGAYIGEGTTIMHEGFVNFNAGTEGPNMVEGRISAGVWVAADSDLGGGCSTMGTLSGGGEQIISIGKNCLIGANAGTGIALGDDCTIEAGLYVTSSTKVVVLGASRQKCKARDLSGRSHLLFRRNSQTGEVECLVNSKNTTVLNAELHDN